VAAVTATAATKASLYAAYNGKERPVFKRIMKKQGSWFVEYTRKTICICMLLHELSRYKNWLWKQPPTVDFVRAAWMGLKLIDSSVDGPWR